MSILQSYLKKNKILSPQNKVYFSVSSEGLGIPAEYWQLQENSPLKI